jgi:hypothetical protein
MWSTLCASQWLGERRLLVFENRDQRRIFEPKRKKQRNWKVDKTANELHNLDSSLK